MTLFENKTKHPNTPPHTPHTRTKMTTSFSLDSRVDILVRVHIVVTFLTLLITETMNLAVTFIVVRLAVLPLLIYANYLIR